MTLETPVGAGRPLTAGERALAREAFNDTLALDPIRLRRAKWFVFQPRRITMAPDGDIWFHPRGPNWREDYSDASIVLQGLLVHELTHCWQVQRGINLVLRRPPWARYDYLPLVPGKPFGAYGLEQQAEIVREHWMLRRGLRLDGRPDGAVYEATGGPWPR